MTVISGSGAKSPTVDLYGTFGSFRLPGSKVSIQYISTFANPTRQGGHSALVDELKPMRDRVSARDLDDLSTLLQRDLNDRRVAQELVPYLKGLASDVGFFPAILAVLVPRGYLASTGDNVRYPSPRASEGAGNSVDYDGFWAVEHFQLGSGEVLPLGTLRVTRDVADIVVLDGQHRANAFRFVAGAFKPESQIYQPFYSGATPAEPFDVDLPVTLIWFESGQEIDPTLISRKLFVDVNNNARPVGTARTLLLDDRRSVPVGTQQVYNWTAKNGFEPERFSLVHSAFDMPGELSESGLPPLTLTAPEIIAEALRWAFYCSSSFDSLDVWAVQRLHKQDNVVRFQQIFPDAPMNERTDPEVEAFDFFLRDPEETRAFRSEFDRQYLGVMTQLFAGLRLLEPHFRACAETAEWVAHGEGTSSAIQEVWEKVYCGGEGLYWSFSRSPLNDQARGYRRAMTEVESRFKKARCQQCGVGVEPSQVDDLYGSVTTKALQTGYVMAVDYIAREVNLDGDRRAAATDLVGRLNNYDPIQWLVIFTEVRPLLLGSAGANPRLWPAYRNLLVRLYDGDRGDVYDITALNTTPEWRMYEHKLQAAADNVVGRLRAEGREPESAADLPALAPELEPWVSSELLAVEDVVRRAGFLARWWDSSRVMAAGRAYLKDRVYRAFFGSPTAPLSG